MSTHEEAQWFLDQLRSKTDAVLGTPPREMFDELVNKTIGELSDRDAQDPGLRADFERLANLAAEGKIDIVNDEILAEMQNDIESTAARSVPEGLDLSRRPLVGSLRTGQLNAVSMRVLDSDGYLVLYEDQMQHFTYEFAHMLAWAIPSGAPAGSDGNVPFRFGIRDIRERIKSNPDIANWFEEIVVPYVTGGKVSVGPRFLLEPMPPGYQNLASQLDRSLNYFVLGHEYSHILLGHLDTAELQKGVLPVAEAETLVYSWQHELSADFLGALLGLQASVNHGKIHLGIAHMGINLFFDALDVMDRAVALLKSGNEETLQLGSHPPSYLRKQRLRESLTKMVELRPDRFSKLLKAQEEILRLLWGHTQSILLDLRRRGIQVAPTWRAIPKETGEDDGARESAGTAAGYGQLGLAAQQRGDYAKARQHYVRALTVYDQIGDREGVATYSAQLGILADLCGNSDEGRRYVTRALAINEEIGDEASAAACCQQLGSRFARDYDEGVRLLTRALAIYEGLNDRSSTARCHGMLGSLAKNRSDYRTAKRRFAAALSIYADLDDQDGIDRCKESMTELRDSRRRGGGIFRRFRSSRAR